MSPTTDRRGTAPRIRVVVLNWNSSELTRRCVRSLLRTDYPSDRLEIVVVDNGSIDGSVAVLRRLFPDVRILPNDANLGFAEGCNRAMRDLDGVDAVALVNNDATVEPDWLWPLVERMATDESIGAVSPKLLFASPYVTVTVTVQLGDAGDAGEVGEGGGATGGSAEPAPTRRARLVGATVDGLDVTRHVLPGEGTVRPPDMTVPLLLHTEIAERGELHLPVDDRDPDPDHAPTARLRVATDRPVTATSGAASVTAGPGPDGVAELTLRLDAPTHRRINNLGTALTPWREGYELRYGDPDDPDLESEEVPGWCGGGVLLRAAYLRDVGLFDPAFFAYYEDTDLSWRGRRAGWRTVTEPRSVLHHVGGATAGSAWPGFFYLNYRNWLLTVLRNGTIGDARVAAWALWRNTWPFFRHNVVGPLRRLRRPDLAITSRWVRILSGVAALAPATLRTRRPHARVGAVEPPLDRVGGPAALLPPSRPRPPAPRPGGPTVCYVDVTATLRSGWRAGIQRVVTELTRRLAVIDDDLEIVPVCWSPLDGAYRRLGPDETESLFRPPTMRNHPPAPPPQPSAVRRIVGPITRVGPIRTAKEAVRRRRALRARPAWEADLVVDAFPAGSVFFDADATWNLDDAPRAELLPRLRERGVRVVALQYDLLPVTHPQWFDPNLARVFTAHTAAHARHAEMIVCISRHTRDELLAYCEREGLDPPPTSVVALGGEPGDDSTHDGAVDDALLASIDGRRVVLSVGTIEPRKNQATLLDAVDELIRRHDDLVLVIVGRQGWRIDELADRIRHHPRAGDAVLWPESVSDATLALLYERATVTVVPSWSEGFGLPVLEALRHGSVVVSSSGGALREAGGDVAEYFDPADTAGLVAAIERHLTDPDHHRAVKERVATFVAPTWDDAAAAVAASLESVSRA